MSANRIGWRVLGTAIIVAGTITAGSMPPATASGNGYDQTYTLNGEFDAGTLFNVNHTSPNDHQLQLNKQLTTFPLMWIANAGEDTVSKIDTDANREVGRYRTWFNLGTHGAWSGPAPSRTAVDADGNAYVLNRMFYDHRGWSAPAYVVKVLSEGYVDHNGDGDMDTAVDLNNDGTVQTSEVLPMGPDANGNGFPDGTEIKDEKIAWIRPVGAAGALGRSLCIGTDGNLWIGLYSRGQYYKVAAATGLVLLGPISTPGNTPYGCAVDATGHLYSAGLGTNTGRLNTLTGTWLGTIGHVAYGITVGNGKVYMSNSGTTYRVFDPATNLLTTSGVGGSSITIGVDAFGNVYAGENGGNTRKHFPNNAPAWYASSPWGVDSRGTIVDSNGDIWRVHLGNSTISKYSGTTGALLHWRNVGLYPYTYSDATGLSARTNTQPSGTWTIVQDSGAPGTIWDAVSWNLEAEGFVPSGASITARVQGADDQGDFATPNWTVVANGDPIAGVLGRYLRVQLTLAANTDGETPILSDVRVVGHPPNSAPVVTCSDVTVPTEPGVCVASANVGDATDPDNDPLTFEWLPPGPYGLGTSAVTFTATDPLNAAASCTANVTVFDNQPPTIECPPAATLECAGPLTAFTPAAATALDNCGATVNSPPAGMFPVGTHVLAYSASDGPNSAACTSQLTVVDTTAPAVMAVTADVTRIWPPDHRMVPITVSAITGDACTGGALPAGSCRIVGITSNEAINSTGDGTTDPDWIIAPDSMSASVRAERKGNGTGRIYTITVECSDGFNTTAGTTMVAVPHSQRTR